MVNKKGLSTVLLKYFNDSRLGEKMQNSDSSNTHQQKLFLLQKVAKYISNNDIPINLRVCTSMPSPTYWSFKHDLILIYSLFEDGIDNFESAIERIKTPNNSNKVKIKISELMIPNRDWLAARRDLLIYEISALIIPKDFDPKSVEALGYQQFLDRYKLQFDHLDSNEIPEVECTKILTVHQIKQLLFFIANYGFVSDSKQTLKKTFDPNDKNSVLINYKKSIKDIRKKSKMENVSISTIEQFICSLLLKCNSYINDLNYNTDILSDIIIKIKQDGGTYEYDKKINLIPNSAIYFISQRLCFFKKLRKALTSFPKKIKMAEYLDSANLPKSKFPEWWTSAQDEVLIKFTSKYGLHHPVELFNQLTKNQPTDNFHEFLTLYETIKSKERLSFPFPISNEDYAEFKFLHDIGIRIERINQIVDALLAVDVQEKSTAEEKVNSNIQQQKPISLDSNDQKQVSTASINPQPISKTSDSSKTVLNAGTAQKSTSNINTNAQSTSNAATVSNQASNSTANTNSVSNKASTLNSVSNVAPISKSIPISATVSKHVFKPTPDTQSISAAASTVQATPNTNLGPQKSSSLPSQKSGASTPTTTAAVSEIAFSKSDVEEIYSKANKIYTMKPKTESDMKRRTLPDPFYQEFSRANPEKLSTYFNITNSVKKFPLGIDESLIPEEELRGLRLFPTNDNQTKARENTEITYKTVFLTEEEYNKRKQLAQQAQQDQQKLRQQQAIQQQKNIIQSTQNQTNPNIPPSMQSNQIGQQRTTNVQHTTYLSQFSNSILQQKQIMQQRQNIQQQQQQQRISIPQAAQTQQQRPIYSQATQAQQGQTQQPYVTQQQQQRQIPQQQTIQQQQQQQQRPTLPLATQQQQQQRQVQQQQTIQQQQRPTLQQATQHQQQRQNVDTTKVINQTESQQASSRSNLLFQPKSSEPLTDKNTDKPQLLRSPPKLSNPTNQQPPRSPPPPPPPPQQQQQQQQQPPRSPPPPPPPPQQQQQQQTAAKQNSEMVPINLPDGFTIAYIPNKSCINVVITKSGKEVNNDTDFDPDDHPNSLCVSLSASISAGKTKFMITWTNFDSSGNEVSSSIKNSNLTTAYNAFKNSLNSMRESSPDLPEIKDKFPYKFFQIKPCVSGDELIEHLL